MEKRFVTIKIGDIKFKSIPMPEFSQPSEYPHHPDGEINSDVFVEWTKEIFSNENRLGPSRIVAYIEETKQMMVEKGVPSELIDVMDKEIAEDLKEVFPSFLIDPEKKYLNKGRIKVKMTKLFSWVKSLFSTKPQRYGFTHWYYYKGKLYSRYELTKLGFKDEKR